MQCLSAILVKSAKSRLPDVAQVSWRCAGRRPSVRLYGVFLRSEADKTSEFQQQVNIKRAAAHV